LADEIVTPALTPTAIAVLAKPSIFKRIEAEAKHLWQDLENDEPQIEKVALGTIAVLVPLATTALTIADPAVAPLVAPIAQRVEAGLAALTIAIEDAGLNPTVPSIAAGINSQLSSFLSVAGVKNPTTVANVGTITTELEAIASAFAA
jgi:hypothetical protein